LGPLGQNRLLSCNAGELLLDRLLSGKTGLFQEGSILQGRTGSLLARSGPFRKNMSLLGMIDHSERQVLFMSCRLLSDRRTPFRQASLRQGRLLPGRIDFSMQDRWGPFGQNRLLSCNAGFSQTGELF
jgi:hypothetical protein